MFPTNSSFPRTFPEGGGVGTTLPKVHVICESTVDLVLKCVGGMERHAGFSPAKTATEVG